MTKGLAPLLRFADDADAVFCDLHTVACQRIDHRLHVASMTASRTFRRRFHLAQRRDVELGRAGQV